MYVSMHVAYTYARVHVVNTDSHLCVSVRMWTICVGACVCVILCVRCRCVRVHARVIMCV